MVGVEALLCSHLKSPFGQAFRDRYPGSPEVSLVASFFAQPLTISIAKPRIKPAHNAHTTRIQQPTRQRGRGQEQRSSVEMFMRCLVVVPRYRGSTVWMSLHAAPLSYAQKRFVHYRRKYLSVVGAKILLLCMIHKYSMKCIFSYCIIYIYIYGDRLSVSLLFLAAHGFFPPLCCLETVV